MSLVDVLKLVYFRLREFHPETKRIRAQESVKRNQISEMNQVVLGSLFGEELPAILEGPFKGMHYLDEAYGSQLLPKILGTYELPIQSWIQEINRGDYAAIIDVGCAEGFYAVGFAVENPKAENFAFDVNEKALIVARQLAQKNDVEERVKFHVNFDEHSLKGILSRHNGSRTFIFMDVEGAEEHLLNPTVNPAVLNCDVLVELHDCFKPGITEKIIDYFHRSHKIEIIVDYDGRQKASSLNYFDISEADWRFCTDESRPAKMRWLRALR
jgi:hypothetical protein